MLCLWIAVDVGKIRRRERSEDKYIPVTWNKQNKTWKVELQMIKKPTRFSEIEGNLSVVFAVEIFPWVLSEGAEEKMGLESFWIKLRNEVDVIKNFEWTRSEKLTKAWQNIEICELLYWKRNLLKCYKRLKSWCNEEFST